MSEEKVQAVRKQLSGLGRDDSKHNDAELQAFLHMNKQDIEKSAKAVITSVDWKEANLISMADISAFYRGKWV